MMKAGAGEGLSSAFGKLADFYIKRAEQMQPVIQVAAGRAVDIVITQGISLQGPYARHAKASHNDRARHKAVEEVYSHTSLPFSPVQKRGDS